MSFLLRTALRYQSNKLSCFLHTPFRSISIYSVKFTEANRKKNHTASEITRSSATNNADLSVDFRPMGQKIKENTATASYLGVIVLGVVVTVVLVVAVCRELFASTSSNRVYSAALKTCINDPRVQDALGPPIKGFGEESRRRRRQHVAHLLIDRSGETYMRMHFYIQGIRNKATVQLEKRLVMHLLHWTPIWIVRNLFLIENSSIEYTERRQISIFVRSTWLLPANNHHHRRQPLIIRSNVRIDTAITHSNI